MVESAFAAFEPVGYPNPIVLTFAHFYSDIEIAVTKGSAVQSGFDPIVVHTECTEKNTAVVAAQIAIERSNTFAFHGDKDGIDELDHIKATKMTKVP